jgi:hypothetical protein
LQSDRRSVIDIFYSVDITEFRQFVEVLITPYQPFGRMGDAVSLQMPCTKNAGG